MAMAKRVIIIWRMHKLNVSIQRQRPRGRPKTMGARKRNQMYEIQETNDYSVAVFWLFRLCGIHSRMPIATTERKHMHVSHFIFYFDFRLLWLWAIFQNYNQEFVVWIGRCDDVIQFIINTFYDRDSVLTWKHIWEWFESESQPPAQSKRTCDLKAHTFVHATTPGHWSTHVPSKCEHYSPGQIQFRFRHK